MQSGVIGQGSAPLRDRAAGGRLAVRAALSLCLLLVVRLVWRAQGEGQRLYWEYGGRMLGRAYTPGYVEWAQHRVGAYIPPELARAPGAALAPYSGFPCEYPPGVLLVVALLRSMADSLPGFTLAFDLLAGGCAFAATVAALAWLRPERRTTGAAALAALLLAAAWPQLMGSLSVTKFDPIAAALVAGGLLAAARDRPGMGGVLLGLGGAVKLWPVLIVPFVAARLLRRAPGQAAAALAAGAAGFLLPHLLLLARGTSPADLFGYLRYLRDRPMEVGSLQANLAMLLRGAGGLPVRTGFDFGSLNIYFAGERAWIAAATFVNLAGLVALGIAALAIGWRRDRAVADSGSRYVLLAGAAVALTILCSRVFSSEYLIWLVPFVLAGCRSRWGGAGVALWMVAALLLKLVYRGDAEQVTTLAVLGWFAKNLCVAGLLGLWLASVWRDAPGAERPA